MVVQGKLEVEAILFNRILIINSIVVFSQNK